MFVFDRRFFNLIFYVFLSGLIFFADSKTWLSGVHSLGQSISDPVRNNLLRTKQDLRLFFTFDKTRLQQERIYALEQENGLLLSRLADRKTLEDENKQMRRLLDANIPETWKFSPASVVSKIADSLFVVSNMQVLEGTPVVIAEGNKGVYLGKVGLVVGGQTRVVLASDVNSKIPVIVRDLEALDKLASGILEGRGGKMVLEQVLSGETLKEGDLVLTSGEAGYPPEMLIGYVGKILSGKNSALQQAEVREVIDASKLDVVFCVTKY